MKPPAEGKSVHPAVRWLWLEMNRQCASQEDVAKRAGVSSSAMRKWRQGVTTPKLRDIEAVINAMGYKLTITPEG